jgi:regulatory protein
MKTPPNIRNTALTLLARREHSEHELRRKLLTRDFPQSDIDIIIPALVTEGLLSNTRFTESYLRYRRQKGYGPLRIQIELSARGIPQDMIDHHLNIADNAWLAHAQTVWQKRFKGLAPHDFKTRAQQMRFLQYRGFTAEQIDTIFHSDR